MPSRTSKEPCLDCGGLKSRRALRCRKCNLKPGPTHPRWTGGRHHHGKGYFMLYAPEHPRRNTHKFVFEHILVMETHLGRYLLPGENVHHKNLVRSDNRIENLELWASSQPSGARVEDLVAWAKEILDTYV